MEPKNKQIKLKSEQKRKKETENQELISRRVTS